MMLLLLILAVILSGHNICGNTLCVYSKTDNVRYNRVEIALEDDSSHQHSISGDAIDSNNTEHCSKGSDSCFALWYEDPVNKTTIVLTQGCWDSANGNCDLSECISSMKPSKALNNTKFCCCSGNLCNINFTDTYEYNITLDPALHYVDPTVYTAPTIIIIVVAAMVLFLIVGLLTYVVFRSYFQPLMRSKESLNLMESTTTPAPMFDFDNLKIQETIGRGRYGTVYRGSLQDHTVAVKIFSYQNRQYYLNEKDIYTLPHMEHPSLLKFIGSDERLTHDGRPEYLIVLSFSAQGCLQDYLRNSTIDWFQLCKMPLSITQGLAHLHTEVGKYEKIKPCIAHRDLTSRNILMKSDGTCMICDFGFAIRISGSKYFQNGEEQVAETTSLADVGTLRYMAPEILEGAVNLRDCESSLKQIDVYALGLVLWEIATRCTDLFQGVEVPEYKLPFESEVGVHPTMEQMQVLVTRHKARPLFPDIWKDSNPAIRTLKETIEECWDQDSEARLTTLCVEERLAELPFLWERYKASLVPTCVSTSNVNKTSDEKSLYKIQSTGSISCEMLNNSEIHIFRERAYSLSEGTTETLLSPSEPAAKDITPVNNIKNIIANNAVSSFKVSTPIQPHQGQNPCLQRNLVLEPVNQVTVSGNILVQSNTKPIIDRNFRSYSDGDTAMLDNTALLSNDLLNHSRQSCSPVPHLKNTVQSMIKIPKEPNVPGNGHTLGLSVVSNTKEKKWRPRNFFDKRKRTSEGIRAGLKSLLERKSSCSNNKSLSDEQQPLKGSSINSCYSPVSPCYSNNKLAQVNNLNCVWMSDELKTDDQLIDTEVCVTKNDLGAIIVRPVNNVRISSKDNENDLVQIIDKILPNGIAKSILNTTVTNSVLSMQNIQEESKTIEKLKRPNSLPLQDVYSDFTDAIIVAEHSDVEIPTEKPAVLINAPLHRKNSKKKGVKRVKTPFEIKGRFSLYDDRIMSSQELSAAYSKESLQPIFGENTKFSTSVPLDMNTFCIPPKTSEQNVKVEHVPDTRKPRNGLKVPVNHNQVIHSFCDI